MRNLEVTLSWIHDPRDPYTLRDATLVAPNWGRSGNLVDWHLGDMPYAAIDTHLAVFGYRISENRLAAASFRHGRMVGTVVLSSIQIRRK